MKTKQLGFKGGFSLETTPSFLADMYPALKAILVLLSLQFWSKLNAPLFCKCTLRSTLSWFVPMSVSPQSRYLQRGQEGMGTFSPCFGLGDGEAVWESPKPHWDCHQLWAQAHSTAALGHPGSALQPAMKSEFAHKCLHRLQMAAWEGG